MLVNLIPPLAAGLAIGAHAAVHVLKGHGQRILIVGSSHVGNNLFCTPAIRFLRRNFPTARIEAVSNSVRGANAFRGNPDLTHVHLAHSNWGIRRLARRFDFVVGMYRDHAARCLRGLAVPHAIIDPDPALHRADQRLEFVRGLSGGEIDAGERRYVIGCGDADRAGIRRQLPSAIVGEVRVGLHLGCGRTAAHGWKFWYARRAADPKLWPIERYIEFAQRLTALEPRVRLVITGSRSERFLGRKFRTAVPGTIDLMGRTSLGGVAALMSEVRLFVTQDTGILHVACATDVPIIGLFGPTNVGATGPYPLRANHTILKRATMAEIAPNDVADAAMASLQRWDPRRDAAEVVVIAS